MIMSGKEIGLSLLCPKLVPVELLLSLQMHGNRNSMMQITTYNPTDQVPFVPFLLFLFYWHSFSQLLVLPGFFEDTCLFFIKKFTVEVKESEIPKSRTITQQQQKNALYFLLVVVGFKQAVSLTLYQMRDYQCGKIVQFIGISSRWQHLLISASVLSWWDFCLVKGAQ